MSIWEAIVLGIIQGITEFLPISSSGHLLIFEYFFGLEHLSQYVFFNLVCHIGTLGAIVCVFYKEIVYTFFDLRKMKQMILALLPLIPLIPFMKQIRLLFDHPSWLGYTFFLNGILLIVCDFLTKEQPYSNTSETSYRSSLYIGVAQSLAIIPGISRSGSTISMARILNWSPYQAVLFSFLLSLPTILGGVFLESLKIFSTGVSLSSMHLMTYFSGFLSSFIVGYFSLCLLIRIIGTAKFQYFGWYCTIVGCLLIYLFS